MGTIIKADTTTENKASPVLCLWGVYIPTRVLWSTEELFLGDIFTKKVACELSSEASAGVFLAKYGSMCVGARLKKSSRKWK